MLVCWCVGVGVALTCHILNHFLTHTCHTHHTSHIHTHQHTNTPTHHTGYTGSPWILPFTAGGFIYIATTSVLPSLLEGESLEWRQSLLEFMGIVFGVVLMLLVGFEDGLFHLNLNERWNIVIAQSFIVVCPCPLFVHTHNTSFLRHHKPPNTLHHTSHSITHQHQHQHHTKHNTPHITSHHTTH